jgi:oxygen-independent coproporphyrinogen III oxidase
MAGIYIHIPFCKKLCHYCDFYHTISTNDFSGYVLSVIKEAELRQNYIYEEKIKTIYIGGGTPSVLPIKELESILKRLFVLYDIDAEAEITIELNPDDIDQYYLDGLKKTPVNRLSIGIQSWYDQDLRLMNRRHNAAQAEKALQDTIDAGFTNISVDLIYGLPGMNLDMWLDNLEKTFSFNIKHLSAYHLTIEPGTVFGKMKEKGLLSDTDEDESTGEFSLLVEKATAEGFVQYEISNFAREGYMSVHNTNYWRQVNYMGLGASAHSFNGYSRQWNISNIGKYIKALNSGTVFYEKEELDTKTKFNEYIMTSLRTMWGIDLDYVERTFEKEGYDFVINISGKFREYGMMKLDKKTLVLTNQGKMISDNIISDFMMV